MRQIDCQAGILSAQCRFKNGSKAHDPETETATSSCFFMVKFYSSISAATTLPLREEFLMELLQKAF